MMRWSQWKLHYRSFHTKFSVTGRPSQPAYHVQLLWASTNHPIALIAKTSPPPQIAVGEVVPALIDFHHYYISQTGNDKRPLAEVTTTAMSAPTCTRQMRRCLVTGRSLGVRYFPASAVDERSLGMVMPVPMHMPVAVAMMVNTVHLKKTNYKYHSLEHTEKVKDPTKKSGMFHYISQVAPKGCCPQKCMQAYETLNAPVPSPASASDPAPNESLLHSTPIFLLYMTSTRNHRCTASSAWRYFLSRQSTSSAAFIFIAPVMAVSVRLGDWNLQTDPDCSTAAGDNECTSPVQDIAIEKITVPSNYTGTGSPAVKQDIALLRLARKVEFNDSVAPICLPLDKAGWTSYSTENGQFHESGWGKTPDGNGGKQREGEDEVVSPPLWRRIAQDYSLRNRSATATLHAIEPASLQSAFRVAAGGGGGGKMGRRRYKRRRRRPCRTP
uniref:Peptidase S1 domain-containing protein n=1 Tax=Anopheles minimus TaxID=112268 RepID=A0A182VQ04_9DIPT